MVVWQSSLIGNNDAKWSHKDILSGVLVVPSENSPAIFGCGSCAVVFRHGAACKSAQRPIWELEFDESTLLGSHCVVHNPVPVRHQIKPTHPWINIHDCSRHFRKAYKRRLLVHHIRRDVTPYLDRSAVMASSRKSLTGPYIQLIQHLSRQE